MTVLKTHHIGENLVPSYIKSVEILSDGASAMPAVSEIII